MPSSYPPRKGGVENAVSNIARQLQQCGHQVTVVTPSDWLRFSVEIEPSGVTVYRMPFALPHFNPRMSREGLGHSLLRSLVSLVSAPVSLARFLRL
ncbi:MAG: glycosyltransferase, partial [Chloroflexota bacterium]|nr:glycosyltransferase [Chloroflexota bacterium]